MGISPIVLQRRQAELGRIRLGYKAEAGNGKTRPAKLERFRFTSPSERYITDLAALYGGDAQQWDNNGKAEWEVYTTATSIPVIAVKGGLSQWMETWSGGGCIHRCDGERDVEGNLCDPKDRAHQAAKPTTRLSVMLPELEAIGVWRLESHGWNAAAEIPAVAELAQFVGDLVPAHLHLVERRAIKDGKTSRFVVPVLDLQIGAAKLREIVNERAGLAELEAPAASSTPALEAPSTSTSAPAVTIPTPEQIAAADLVTLRRMTDYLHSHGLGEHPARRAALARIDFLEDHEDDAPQPNPDGTYDAQIVEDQGADPDMVWQQILAATGRLGWSLEKTQSDFISSMGGLDPGAASATELQAYLQQITTGEAVAS